jgi:WD40 repeat protein
VLNVKPGFQVNSHHTPAHSGSSSSVNFQESPWEPIAMVSDYDRDDSPGQACIALGIEPEMRGTESEEMRLAQKRNAEIQTWLVQNEVNTEIGDEEDLIIELKRHKSRTRRQRAHSTNTHNDAPGLSIIDNSDIPRPGLLLDEDGEDNAEDFSSETSPDSPPANIEKDSPQLGNSESPSLDEEIPPEQRESLPRQFYPPRTDDSKGTINPPTDYFSSPTLDATSKTGTTLESRLSLVRSMAFSPGSKLVASGPDDDTVRLWDAATGVARGTIKGHSASVLSVAFSPDSKLVPSGSYDKTVRLWEVATGAARSTLEGHSDWVLSVVFSSDGKLFASGSYDKTVRLWDAAAGAV